MITAREDCTRRIRDRKVRPGWALKRTADRAVAGLLLVLLAPLLAVVSICIKIDTRGPVFYRQTRVGRNGRPFSICKFRSMVVDSEKLGLGAAVAKGDERVTRIGAPLRMTSLDELPQLINVVRGEMSLVGPRPTVPEQVAEYTGRQIRRLEVAPGLTGWAQVNGRNSLSWADRIELDLWYVDHWSIWLDLRILARTPRALANQEGVYGPDGVTRAFRES